jgi:hypothetical protein
MDVEQSDYVGVIAKMLQEHDFTEGSLGVGLIPESVCTHRQKKGIRIKFNIKRNGQSVTKSPFPLADDNNVDIQQQNTHVTIQSLPSVT